MEGFDGDLLKLPGYPLSNPGLHFLGSTVSKRYRQNPPWGGLCPVEWH